MIVAGIDPGFSGAICVLDREKTSPLFLGDMPVLQVGDKRELDAGRVKTILQTYPPEHVYIEKAQSMPGQGVSSTGRYMASWGMIVGVCVGLGIKYTLVPPQTWKKAMMQGMAKEKDASIARAKQLYPGVEFLRKKDHGLAEALLIAEYGLSLN